MSDLRWPSGAVWLLQLQRLGLWVLGAGGQLLAIFLLYWLARRLLTRAVDQILPSLLNRAHPATPVRESRVRTIGGVLKRVGYYVLLFIAGVMALKALNRDVTPIFASAGIVGLAVGFGAQKLVKDVITGFLMLVEDQFDVG
jgi:moderate conductance mechanosensitive channel